MFKLVFHSEISFAQRCTSAGKPVYLHNMEQKRVEHIADPYAIRAAIGRPLCGRPIASFGWVVLGIPHTNRKLCQLCSKRWNEMVQLGLIEPKEKEEKKE